MSDGTATGGTYSLDQWQARSRDGKERIAPEAADARPADMATAHEWLARADGLVEAAATAPPDELARTLRDIARARHAYAVVTAHPQAGPREQYRAYAGLTVIATQTRDHDRVALNSTLASLTARVVEQPDPGGLAGL